MKRPPLYVAVHEAGHVISMLSSDPPLWVDYVSLMQLPENSVGFTRGGARFNIGLSDQLAEFGQRERLTVAANADVVDFLAGPVAELRFRKHCVATRRFIATRWAERAAGADWGLSEMDDFSKARLRLAWCDASIVKEAFLDRWHDAEAVVRKHWRHILDLARWLHKAGHIEDDELVPWWKSRQCSKPISQRQLVGS